MSKGPFVEGGVSGDQGSTRKSEKKGPSSGACDGADGVYWTGGPKGLDPSRPVLDPKECQREERGVPKTRTKKLSYCYFIHGPETLEHWHNGTPTPHLRGPFQSSGVGPFCPGLEA